MAWQSDFELAKNAASRAGTYLRDHPADILEETTTNWRDVKLQADCESEKIILDCISSASPYPLLAEESGEHDLAAGDTPFWIIDPLDGSLNYSRGIPFFCVSIALWQGQQPLLGVVYHINSDELFSGIVGQGAWCNDRIISVSTTASPKEAMLATGFPVNRDFHSESLQRFLRDVQQFKKVRLLGSAALSLAYVAAGRVDAYYEDDIMLWDVAAGIALIKAAGGWIDVRPSTRHKWGRRVMCAASDSIFQEHP